MIEDLREHPDGAVLDTDLCIIGAGAAGLTLAMELKASQRGVLVLEAGGARSKPIRKRSTTSRTSASRSIR
jgi:flavin-dependent dehydrogenase